MKFDFTFFDIMTTINIGQISPLILHTDISIEALRNVGIHSKVTVYFSNDGQICLRVCEPNMDKLLYNTLVQLTLPKSVASRRFIWLNINNNIIMHTLTHCNSMYDNNIIIDVYIDSYYGIFTYPKHQKCQSIFEIIKDNIKLIISGDIDVHSYGGVTVYFGKHIKINPEMAEIIARSVYDQVSKYLSQ